MDLNKKQVTAVLGPTNTGKTYMAIETMLDFESGIMGFPLRLLAREVYEKVLKRVNPSKVALITGEEKIIPANARYFLCTTESMPIDKSVEFIGVDEIQMCADHERGHIFTDRLLNLRAEKITMFLGSHTMRNIIESLEEDVEFISKERFSKLAYGGQRKISRLNRKTAIIAFSGEEVYAIAELVRRQKGGSAIVMGSLSPKTRNSQVELYQSGDVDYLVATDAIGMGINMDIDNVYFTNLNKFDGKKLRRLNLSEISQIAGRAGRHVNDGIFGITGQCKNLTSEEIELIENHKLESLQRIFWRNSNLDFTNSETLINSLEKKPNKLFLKRINDCEDEKILKYFLKNNSKFKIPNEKNILKILWDCCQIPDFVKHTYGHHLEVVSKVFNFLTSGKERVPNSYMREQIKNLDKLDGNVDTLTNRISNVRTWAYVSNKKNWIQNQDYWIERTKTMEDKLSDRLHEELAKSFVDKRASVLARSLKQDRVLETEIKNNKEVIIDGQYIGELKGLKLNLDFKIGALDTDIKSLRKAARQGISPELKKRVHLIISSGILKLNEDFVILWLDNPIARIIPGKNYLEPDIDLITDDILDLDSKNKLIEFFNDWLKNLINTELKDLVNLNKFEQKNSSLRALCYQLFENNGVLKRDSVNEFIKNLTQEDRRALRSKGIKIGRYHIFLHRIFKPNAVTIRVLLWKIFFQNNLKLNHPKFGLNFLNLKKTVDQKFMLICGFEKFENFFVRIDILERLFIKIIENKKENRTKLNSDMINLLGCNKDNFIKLLELMNYKVEKRKNEDEVYFRYIRKNTNNKKKPLNKNKKNDNPFNILTNINYIQN
jgi:ATP-dependent RNA helicase SUPV3L1/SUV3